MIFIKLIVLFYFSLVFLGCGGSQTPSDVTGENVTGRFIDKPVEGLGFVCTPSLSEGKTNEKGEFNCKDNDEVEFFIGKLRVGKTKADMQIVTPYTVFPNDIDSAVNLARILQSLDTKEKAETIVLDQNLSLKIPQNLDLSSKYIEAYLPKDIKLVSSEEAQNTMDSALIVFGEKLPDQNTTDEQNSSQKAYTLIAWSDTGMHCMDKDYSIFSILPPSNNLRAMLIVRGASPRIVNFGAVLTYESKESLDHKENTFSVGKVNFWDYVKKLFLLQELEPDKGLKGNFTPSDTPQKMNFDSKNMWWKADGIPLTPYNDDGSFNPYSFVKVVAKDLNGEVLATTQTVLPVSDEMDCAKCHSSDSLSEAKPLSGWAYETDVQRDFRLNILKLHDEKNLNRQNYQDAIKKVKEKGYDYELSLAKTAQNGTPILCISCHKSNLFKNSGVDGVLSLTKDIHKHKINHDKYDNLNTCYLCHPGHKTQCLRGSMSTKSKCQDCHGSMEDLTKQSREGWQDEPKCQSCHQNTKRYKSVFIDNNTTLRDVLDKRFATENIHNFLTDTDIKELYKDSKGHGGLSCAVCHGSQHSISPSNKTEDNIQNIDLQGYKGTLNKCSVCHEDKVKPTSFHGPHGLHVTGQVWVDKHGTIVNRFGNNSCKSCHGEDLQGSDLSKTFEHRTLKLKYLDKNITFQAGHKVSCKDCH